MQRTSSRENQLRSGQVHFREHGPACVRSYYPEQRSYTTPILSTYLSLTVLSECSVFKQRLIIAWIYLVILGQSSSKLRTALNTSDIKKKALSLILIISLCLNVTVCCLKPPAQPGKEAEVLTCNSH